MSSASKGTIAPLPRPRAYALGVGLGLLVVLGLLSPIGEEQLSLGPANAGHADLSCQDCHRPARGTARQQIQANLAHWLGWRATPADFGHRAVENRDCRACHENPDDQHPPYRFNEPRFDEARRVLAPQHCVSCHREHSGGRVTTRADSCQHCHAELKMRNDPISPSHAALVSEAEWSSCLRCHDFHGNHARKTPTVLSEGASVEAVESYLSGGPDPYGLVKRFPAKGERKEQR